MINIQIFIKEPNIYVTKKRKYAYVILMPNIFEKYIVERIIHKMINILVGVKKWTMIFEKKVFERIFTGIKCFQIELSVFIIENEFIIGIFCMTCESPFSSI